MSRTASVLNNSSILNNSSTTPRRRSNRDCIVIRALKKVLAFLKRARHFLLPWSKSPYSLNPAQARLRSMLQEGIVIKKFNIKPRERFLPSGSDDEKGLYTIGGSEYKHQFIQLNPTLKNVQDFVGEVVNVTTEKAYDRFVGPYEQDIKDYIAKIPDVIRPIFKKIIQAGNSFARPIFSSLRNVPTHLHKCANAAALDYWDNKDKSTSLPFLEWLCQGFAALKNDKKDEIKEEVKKYALGFASSKKVTLSDNDAAILMEMFCAVCENPRQEIKFDQYQPELAKKAWKKFIFRTLDYLVKDPEFGQPDKISPELKIWLQSAFKVDDAKKELEIRVNQLLQAKIVTANTEDVERVIEKSLSAVYGNTAPSPLPPPRNVQNASVPVPTDSKILMQRVGSSLISILIEKKLHLSGVGFEEVEQTHLNLLNWLLQEKSEAGSNPVETMKREALAIQVKEKVEHGLKTRSHDKPQLTQAEADKYADHVVGWLYKKEQREPLDQSYNVIAFKDKELMEMVFEYSLQILLQQKIHNFFERFQKTCTTNLKDIIQNKFLKTNLHTLTQILTERVCLLLDNTKYTNTFDELIEVLYTFGKSFAKAKEEKKELKQAIDDLKKQVELRPKNETEGVAHAKHRASWEKIQQIGEEEFIEGRFLKKFAETQREFASSAPGVKSKKVFSESAMMLLDSTVQGLLTNVLKTEQQFEQRRVERDVITNATEKLLKILLPPRTVTLDDGTTKTIDGISYLWFQCEIPNEIIEIFKEAETMLDEILPLSIRTFIKDGIQEFKPYAMSLVAGFLRDQIQKTLVDSLHGVIVKLSQSDEIAYQLCTQTLPMVEKGIVEGFAFEEIYKNLKEFGPHFKEFYDSCINIDQLYDRIKASLMRKVRNNFREFNFKNAQGKSPADEYDDATLQIRIRPAIETLAQWICEPEQREKINQSKNKISPVDLIPAYKNAEDKTKPEEKKYQEGLYSELVDDYLFRIGEFQTTATWIASGLGLKGTITGLLGKDIWSGAATYRDSYHNAVKYILRTLDEIIFDPANLAKMFKPEETAVAAGPVQSLEEAKTENEELERQKGNKRQKIKAEKIDRLARLLYDSMTAQTPALKLGISTNALRTTLDNVLSNLFSHTVLSEGLLATVTEIVLDRLDESSRGIKNHNSTLPPVVNLTGVV